jgi:hypothetical protein
MTQHPLRGRDLGMPPPSSTRVYSAQSVETNILDITAISDIASTELSAPLLEGQGD